jgi:hypothetical protein
VPGHGRWLLQLVSDVRRSCVRVGGSGASWNLGMIGLCLSFQRPIRPLTIFCLSMARRITHWPGALILNLPSKKFVENSALSDLSLKLSAARPENEVTDQLLAGFRRSTDAVPSLIARVLFDHGADQSCAYLVRFQEGTRRDCLIWSGSAALAQRSPTPPTPHHTSTHLNTKNGSASRCRP